MSGVMNTSSQRAFKAAADLSEKQFYGVALGTGANEVVLANAQTNNAIGILLNDPKQNDTAHVQLFNKTQFGISGGVITKGDKLTFDANGKLIATTTDKDLVAGLALEAAADGDRFEFMLGGYTLSHV